MRRREEIVALVLVMAALAALLVLRRPDQMQAAEWVPARMVRTSYGAMPGQYKALYLTLGRLGYHTRRLLRPYPLLPPRGLLIVADPYKVPISAFEARRLFDWIRRGNHALVLVEHHAELLTALNGHPPDEADQQDSEADDEDTAPAPQGGWQVLPSVGDDAAATAIATAPSFLSAAAPALRVASHVRFSAVPLPEELRALTGVTVPLYRDRQGTCVAYSAVGEGGIVWCCSPWSFSTAGLREGNNLEFALALANLHPQDPVIFDEYHHGFGRNMSLWSLAPLYTKLGIAVCALALCLLLYTLGWRFGPPRLPDAERFTRSRAEYLTSMAGMLERIGATHLVYQRLCRRLRQALGHRLNLSATLPWGKLLEANQQHPVVEHVTLERLVTRLTALESVRRPDPEVLCRLAGEIARLLA